MTDQHQLGFIPLLSAEQRAKMLLYGQPQPVPPLTREQRELLRRLVFHVGHRSPITRRTLEERAGLNEREVKAAIRDLVIVHQLPIGASRGKDHGYFLVDSPEDVEIAISPLEGEIRELARRVRILGGKERLAELCGQLPLESEKSA